MFTVPANKLRGKTEQDVKATAAAAAAAYEEMRDSGDHIDTTTSATRDTTTRKPRSPEKLGFSYGEAKQRFLDAVETEIGANRRTEIEAHFRQSVEPFFLAKHDSTDPEQWPAIFDLFRTWLIKGRRRLDGRPGHIKARTANCHMASVNKFLRFCREVYGLSVSSNCKRFGKKILDRESRANDGNGVTTLHDVWSEEEFAEFRKVAYKLDSRLALAYDLCFGLGLRRGESLAIQVGKVHLDDSQLGPLGFVEVDQQYTEELATGKTILKLPKWEKPRVVPVPYRWMRDALRERLAFRSLHHLQNSFQGLRYVSRRYPNTQIARAMGGSEGSVRKWLRRSGITRAQQSPVVAMTDEILADIRRHLLGGRRPGGPNDYLLADDLGRLPSPNHGTTVFMRITEQAGLKRIRVHDLRHSFGSIWAQRVPIPVLKEMMGHASVKTTERYIHVSGEVLRLSMTQALSDIGPWEEKS